jgi:hypothetical protein
MSFWIVPDSAGTVACLFFACDDKTSRDLAPFIVIDTRYPAGYRQAALS